MALGISLSTGRTAGSSGHTTDHNATNTAVNATAAAVDTMRGGGLVFDACENYSAAGDGSTDDTAAIQAAITAASAAGGGRVHLRGGTYRLTSALTLSRRVELTGDGIAAEQAGTGTILYQESTSANAVAGVDLRDVTIENMSIVGPGSGTGKGLSFTRSVNPDISGLTLRRVQVSGFGAYGIDISNPITSTLDRVLVDSCPVGIYLHGVLGPGGSAGTSVSLLNCYTAGCTQSGTRIDNMAYCAFVGCASDACGIAYELIESGTQGISFVGCGCESMESGGASYPGIGWKINAAIGVTLSGCYSFDALSTSVWVTGNAAAISVTGFSENTPQAGVVNSIIVDAGSAATISDISVTKPTSLLGTVVLINDAGGMFVPGYLYVGGTPTFDGAAVFNGRLKLPRYTTAGRPAAATAGAGSAIFNTTTNLPNYSDGTNWRNAAGTIV